MSRIIWIFIGLAAIFATAAGFFAPRYDSQAQLDLIVSNTEQDLGEVNLGILEVIIQLSNPSKYPRRVIGMTELCAGSYCFMMVHSKDTIVQAGESCPYKFKLLIKKPGPFKAEGSLFLEGNGLQEVPLKIQGIAVTPAKSIGTVTKGAIR